MGDDRVDRRTLNSRAETRPSERRPPVEVPCLSRNRRNSRRQAPVFGCCSRGLERRVVAPLFPACLISSSRGCLLERSAGGNGPVFRIPVRFHGDVKTQRVLSCCIGMPATTTNARGQDRRHVRQRTGQLASYAANADMGTVSAAGIRAARVPFVISPLKARRFKTVT